MAVLGLLLLAAATVVGVEVVRLNDATVTVSTFGYLTDLTAGGLFLAGAAAGLLATLGLLLLLGGFGRMRRRRAERRQLKSEKTRLVSERDQEISELADENARLREELATERREQLTMGGITLPPGEDVPYGDQVSDAVYADSGEPYPTESTERGRHEVETEGRTLTGRLHRND